ncbi:MAG: FCD domain-containing protein, partial [Trebonia sp.]
MVNQSLALSVSVPRFTLEELDELDELDAALKQAAAHAAGFGAWNQTHQRFHLLLLSHSGPRMFATAAEWAAHTRRYRRAYVEEGGGWSQGAAEHATLAQLCR